MSNIPCVNPPAKPITRAYITVQGDPSVGIPHEQYTAELNIDPTCYEPEDWPLILLECRNSLEKAYCTIHGEEHVRVVFDFEVEAQ